MSGPKGVVSDLTSISTLLGTILDQTKEIFSTAGGAAEAVGKVTSGGGSAGAGAFSGTKRGAGTQSLGLANVPAAGGGTGMRGAAGMQDEVKFGLGSTAGGADAGSNSMSGWMGKAFGGKLGSIAGGIAMGVGMGADALGAVSNAMPDVNTVISRAGSYYHAGVEQGNQFSSTQLQNMANRNGLNYLGQAAGQVTDYMSTMGINAGSASFGSTSREISAASRYLNMDPMAAAQAFTGLHTGTTSAQLMKTMGIATSDAHGNSLTADQIFNQLDSRLLQQGVKYSVDDVNNNWLKGGVQASLQNAGLSADQAEAYHQHLLEKVQGLPTDLSKTATLDNLTKNATSKGNENPYTAKQQIDASTQKEYQSYQDAYVKGLKDSVPIIQQVNKFMSELPEPMKRFKAEMDSLAGDRAISAGTHGASNLVNDIVGGVGTLLGIKAVKDIVAGKSKLPGDVPKGTATAAEKSASKTAQKSAEEAATKSAAKTAAKTGEQAATKTATKIGAETATKLGAKSLGKLIPGLDIAVAAADATTGIYSGLKAASKDDGSWKKDPWGSLGKQVAADQKAQGPVMTGLDILTGGLLSGNTVKYGARLVGSQINPIANPASAEYQAVYNTPSNPMTPIMKLIDQFSTFMNGFNTQKRAAPAARASGGASSTVGTAPAGGAGSRHITFIKPVPGAITDGFGPRKQPTAGATSYHMGLDIEGPYGSVIHAAADGVVNFAGSNGTMGQTIGIDHGGGYVSKYGHQVPGGFMVHVGSVVKQGDGIGHIGMTGVTTGPHVHFQVELNGKPIDPTPLLSGGANVSGGGAAAGATAAQNQNAAATPTPNPRLALTSTGVRSQGDIVSSVSQAMPAFAAAAPLAFGGQQGGNASIASPLVASSMLPKGAGGSAGSGGQQSSMSVPGARYFKQGDDYVAQDSHVNVHAGEAILNAEAADEWRREKAGGKKKGGGDVKIYLTIQDASDAEARKFANRVKNILEEERTDYAMGNG